MKIAYLDLIGGLSGDMLLGAWLDAGLPVERVAAALADLGEPGLELASAEVSRGGLRGRSVRILGGGRPQARTWSALRRRLETSALPPSLAQQTVDLLGRLAAVEGQLHGEDPATVHLHEVGGLDTVADVLGTLVALKYFDIERVFASEAPFFGGEVLSAHGPLPLPAPATLELLKGVPLRPTDSRAELVTPTGALLLTALSHGYGPPPPLTVEAIGYGAGERDDPDRPNLLRILIGTATAPARPLAYQLETNLDNLNPELMPVILDHLLALGALDAFITPIIMKKGRPAFLLTVLATPETVGPLEEAVLRETGALGVRHWATDRLTAERRWTSVETPFGAVRIKHGSLGSDPLANRPEFADCQALAERQGIPVRVVYEAALAAAGQADSP